MHDALFTMFASNLHNVGAAMIRRRGRNSAAYCVASRRITLRKSALQLSWLGSSLTRGA